MRRAGDDEGTVPVLPEAMVTRVAGMEMTMGRRTMAMTCRMTTKIRENKVKLWMLQQKWRS